jgi:hypothetical protein
LERRSRTLVANDSAAPLAAMVGMRVVEGSMGKVK